MAVVKRPKPWGDRSWTSTARPTQPVAPIAEAAPDGLRSWKVAVVTRECTVRYAAFTTDRWQERYPTCCTHHVSAVTAETAKMLAIDEHKANCLRRAI
jgi:hypothetical protein